MKIKLSPVAVLSALVLVTMLISISSAFAQNEPRSGCATCPSVGKTPSCEKVLDRWRKDLRLTDAQVCQLRGIHEAYVRDNAADIARAKELMMALTTILREPGTCRVDDALAVWRDLAPINDRLAQAGIRMLFDIKRILSVDQQRKLCEIMGKRCMNCWMHPLIGCLGLDCELGCPVQSGCAVGATFGAGSCPPANPCPAPCPANPCPAPGCPR